MEGVMRHFRPLPQAISCLAGGMVLRPIEASLVTGACYSKRSLPSQIRAFLRTISLAGVAILTNQCQLAAPSTCKQSPSSPIFHFLLGKATRQIVQDPRH